jgi:hypothetical protein
MGPERGDSIRPEEPSRGPPQPAKQVEIRHPPDRPVRLRARPAALLDQRHLDLLHGGVRIGAVIVLGGKLVLSPPSTEPAWGLHVRGALVALAPDGHHVLREIHGERVEVFGEGAVVVGLDHDVALSPFPGPADARQERPAPEVDEVVLAKVRCRFDLGEEQLELEKPHRPPRHRREGREGMCASEDVPRQVVVPLRPVDRRRFTPDRAMCRHGARLDRNHYRGQGPLALSLSGH